MKRLLLASCLILIGSGLKAQRDTIFCKGLTRIHVEITTQDFPFILDSLSIDADSIAKGFKLLIPDKSVKLMGFKAYYESDDGDIYYREIYGNSVNPKNFPILNDIKKGSLIAIECINLEKANKRFSRKPLVMYLR